MEHDVLTTYIGLATLLGMLIFPAIVAYDNALLCRFSRKILCRLGWHEMKKNKIRKYYCQHCKKPRNYPDLKIIDGKNKVRDNNYKF